MTAIPSPFQGRCFPDPFPPACASAWGDDPYGLWCEIEVGGVVQRQYTYGHALLSENKASGVRYYGMDAQRNVRYLTDPSGTVTDQYTYDAFGNLIASSGTTPNTYRFAGEHLDANLGLYYLRARYYNANLGRFWSRDPADINPDDPRELNRYVYVAANPVNQSDPTGFLAIETAAPGRTSGTVAGQTLLAVVGQNVLLSIGAAALTLCAVGTTVSLSTAVASSHPCDVTHFNVFYSGSDTPFTTSHIVSCPPTI